MSSPATPAAVAARRQSIGVLGLWHLGSVTAACLAAAGNDVLGVDPDQTLVEGLSRGSPAVSEPGLRELLGRNSSRLRFSTDPAALAEVRQAWIAFDTPVDEEDRADVEWVLTQAQRLLAPLPENALVVVSSQLPVGSIARLQERCASARGDGGLRFACVPENLRLGRALESFQAPDRIVAGVRSDEDRHELAELLAPFSGNVQWMRVESAEMTKHALNGFLATSIAFMNEVASICESVGADAAEVSRALKSERRIGPRAYLDPGDAFAGGTLARDIGFLSELARRHELSAHVFCGVADGNAAHRHWTRRKLLELLSNGVSEGSALTGLLGDSVSEGSALAGRTVAIWGLTYKPGTNTLRRSSAVELCRWLLDAGAAVRAHDPAVGVLPRSLEGPIELCSNPLRATTGADALVVCTAWPEYREEPIDRVVSSLSRALVIDPAGLLAGTLGSRRDVLYVRVGAPLRERATPAAGPPRADAVRSAPPPDPAATGIAA
jgi:UDPglucose 6-dehydrogenase